MAFESLSDKLQNIFKNLRGKGRLSEADVKAALKEVKMALLEADVSFKVVKQFISSIQERAVGEEVFGSLTPGQTVIKIVTEELVKLMGSETTEIALKPGNEITVIMMAGLQGAGKTTTTAKIAAKLKAKGKKPLLVACDVYRPAAIKQLQINGEKVDVPVFSMGDKISPVDIAKAAVEHASKNGFNVVILDTAGRLHIDEGMMEELEQIKETVNVYQTILVVDAMACIHLDAQGVGQLRGAFQTGQLRRAFLPCVVGKASGMKLHHGRSQTGGGVHLSQLRINEQAHLNAVVSHSCHGGGQFLFMKDGVQAAFRSNFLTLFRDHADIVRFQPKGKVHHLRGIPHFQVQGKGHALTDAQGVRILHVAAVPPDMEGDGIRPAPLRRISGVQNTRLHVEGIKHGRIAGLPQRGDVVYIYT